MNEIERILQSIDSILQKVKQKQFSDGGWVRLDVKIKQYVNQLIKESVKVARKHKADSVSPSFVNHASDYLLSGRASWWQKLWEIIANVSLGIGSTIMISMMLANKYSSVGVIFSVVLILIGVIAVVLQLKD